jgi:hypothetical protein
MKDKLYHSIRIVFKVSLFAILLLGGCNNTRDASSTDELYAVFKEPPAGARPFVRWWWNGDCIEPDELERELDVMKAAGIGGVEVNPIEKPEGGDDFDYRCYDWLSPEWNARVKATVEMASERNMIVDLIMGSGWPFGGRFLNEDQLLQGVGIKKMELAGPGRYELDIKEVWQLPGRDFGSYNNPDAPEPDLFFLQMIPHGASGESELIDLIENVNREGRVVIEVPEGSYDLYIGTFQKAYRSVMHGAPGSDGPVVDHYDASDVRAYMDKLAGSLEALLGGKLGDHIRALFCDSIELSGANLTDDLFEEFRKRRGYDLKPFVPLVYYHPYEGYTDTLRYDAEFNEDIQRIRYDFNKTLVELFLERFTKTFDDWANEHHMQSRYQAYGMPWLVGMLDGYRMVDIPESNNWLYSANAKAHGYWIWNKYTSSGAHLSGANIVSCEAMTNTRGVFRMTLDMVKKNDDFNFITGINHSVLHGYNYSPPEAGFPGWIRFGAYFSDQNTWWPYFRHWADYNARLSAVFQHTQPVTDIAILTPEADIWKQWGLVRYPFYMNPWYNHDLWEGFSRLGVMADYINEGVLQRAFAVKGQMKSEEAEYKLVIVSGAQSIEPETAAAINDLAEKGVKFLFVDQMPSEAPSYFEKDKNDRTVKDLMGSASSHENVRIIDAPGDAASVTSWAGRVLGDFTIRQDVTLSTVNEKLYLLKHRSGSNDIYFFSNQDEMNGQDFTATFAGKGKTVWCWDPHTGDRFILPGQEEGRINIRLQALESLLMVLEESDEGVPGEQIYPDEESGLNIGEQWQLDFQPVRDENFSLTTDRLFEYGNHEDQRISAFAGRVSYKTTFHLKETDWSFLDLGIEKHVTEVKLNGENLGIRWWGRHLYHIAPGILKAGENQLEIVYTTTLANYANSLTGNEVARRWIKLEAPDPMGLTGDFRLMKSR